uniref:Fmp27_GFWDK domain-containing protein n=1 Tax=Macrostomum lignano TaxID=282301 RepID=A0A1I8G0X7_9PLAT
RCFQWRYCCKHKAQFAKIALQRQSNLMILQLGLLFLCLGHFGVETTSVHEVAISVRSVKSIVYRGMQLSIFEHVEMPRRYFFQPLSFLDAASARLVDNSELKLTELHFDVYLWTDEFIQLVESHFAEHKSVELLPLTEISLTWSKHASMWLGAEFNRTYRLLDEWKDGDKPHMRSTFTIFCDKRDACERLMSKFNQSNEAIGNIFDLRYKIQCDNSRNFSLTVRSNHFLQSSVFQYLDRFASQRPADRQVIIPEQSVNELADQVYTAALVELQREAKQHFTYVDSESRQAILADLHRHLRSRPVHSLSDFQWRNYVAWPADRLDMRPDKLAHMFNALFTASDRPLTVQLTSADRMNEVRETLPTAEFMKIDAFVRRYTPRRPTDTVPIPVTEVRDLSLALSSPVVWNVSTNRFTASPNSVMFRINIEQIKSEGTLLIRDVLVFYKETAHRDQVTPLDRSKGGIETTWRAQADQLDTNLQQLQQKVRQLESSLRRVLSEFDSWTSVYAPGGRGPSGVNLRSGEAPVEFYPPVGPREAMPDLAALRRSLASLETRVAGLAANRSRLYQPRFADSFCVLANRENPPGMTCQILSMIIPKKSLRYSPIFDRRIRYQEGRIGQSHLSELNDDFVAFSLKICCTA